MRKTREEKAITLIALIITIVVLLILVVVAINAVTGDGIIQHATNAKTEYEKAQDKEESILESYETKLQVATLPQENVNALTAGKELVTTTVVIDEAGKKFVVPQGYSIVRNSTTNNRVSVDEGAVIQDISGNQWVWIPAQVSMMSEVINEKNVGKLYKFTNSGVTKRDYPLGSINGGHEPDVITGATEGDSASGNSLDAETEVLEKVLEGKYANTQTAASFKSQLQAEFDSMIQSVSKYGGYYIARYETSGTKDNPMLKAEQDVLVNIDWYDMYVSAKKLSANDKVQTGMIWGSQWDNTLIWLVNSGNKEWADIVNPNTWGNYKDSSDNAAVVVNGENQYGVMQKTGYSEYWKAGNIYDLAGNFYDCTLECNASFRVNRGGGSGFNAINAPASYRNGNEPNVAYDFTGYRATLIIK